VAEPARRLEPAGSSAAPLVRVENLVKHFGAGLGTSVKAVDGVSFDIREGETLGLVGESGCGKSTLGRLITQLIPATSGSVSFDDVELTKLRGEKLRQQRRQLQMIFQDPFGSLDPRMTVGDIIRSCSGSSVSIRTSTIATRTSSAVASASASASPGRWP